MALNTKQKKAIELLTNGSCFSYTKIAHEVGVSRVQLWNWRTQPQFEEFQSELAKLNELKWLDTVDAAREGALKLCKDGNQRMIEFVLKNEGYNPSQKVEADLHTDININIEE